MLLLCIIGIGSILFHGTLRYMFQLSDEVPMFWLSFLSAIAYYYRHDYDKSWKLTKYYIEKKKKYKKKI